MLITLGIIGVVAALTIPNLVANYKKQQVVTKLKYVYSVMSQAMVTAQSEGGDFQEWDLGLSYDVNNVKRIVHEYILPYIQYIDEGIQNNRYYIQLKNGIVIGFKLDGASAEGKPPSAMYMYVNINNDKKAVTTLSNVYTPSNLVNYSKNDFVLNFDMYSNKLAFFNWGGDTREGIMNTSVYKCNKDNPANLRINCGALIFHDGWQIKDDYPW